MRNAAEQAPYAFVGEMQASSDEWCVSKSTKSGLEGKKFDRDHRRYP